jgi:hypothetical protein
MGGPFFLLCWYLSLDYGDSGAATCVDLLVGLYAFLPQF